MSFGYIYAVEPR